MVYTVVRSDDKDANASLQPITTHPVAHTLHSSYHEGLLDGHLQLIVIKPI